MKTREHVCVEVECVLTLTCSAALCSFLFVLEGFSHSCAGEEKKSCISLECNTSISYSALPWHKVVTMVADRLTVVMRGPV